MAHTCRLRYRTFATHGVALGKLTTMTWVYSRIAILCQNPHRASLKVIFNLSTAANIVENLGFTHPRIGIATITSTCNLSRTNYNTV